MALRLYTGEYLIAPYLLHFGGNWCTHNCQYCFANLNKPDRMAEVTDIAKLYKWYDTGSTTMEFELLKRGHPLMMSNDADPCSKSNWAVFSAVHDASKALGFRMVYQTRGGMREAEDRIVNDAPTTVYVSLTTDREDIRKKFDPGAPTHEQRMDFVRRLREAGHFVIIGLNPLIPSWWRDQPATLGRLANMGIGHIWHQAVHLSRFQVAAMRDTQKASLGEFIAYAQAKSEPDRQAYDDALQACRDAGMNLFCGGVSERLGFWDSYFKDCGFPFVPTLDAWLRDCAKASGGKPLATSLDAFNEWADLELPKRAVWKEFLNPIGRSIRNLGEKVEEAKCQADVHRFLWRIEDFPTTLERVEFARITKDGGICCDEQGVPLMAVSAAGFSEPGIDASLCHWNGD